MRGCRGVSWLPVAGALCALSAVSLAGKAANATEYSLNPVYFINGTIYREPAINNAGQIAFITYGGQNACPSGARVCILQLSGSSVAEIDAPSAGDFIWSFAMNSKGDIVYEAGPGGSGATYTVMLVKNGISTSLYSISEAKYPVGESGLNLTDDDTISYQAFDGRIYRYRNGKLDTPFPKRWGLLYGGFGLVVSAGGLGATLDYEGTRPNDRLVQVDVLTGTYNRLGALDGLLDVTNSGSVSVPATSADGSVVFEIDSASFNSGGYFSGTFNRVYTIQAGGKPVRVSVLTNGGCTGSGSSQNCRTRSFILNDQSGFAVNGSGTFVGTLIDQSFTGDGSGGIIQTESAVLNGDPKQKVALPGDHVGGLRIDGAEVGQHAINDLGQIALYVSYPAQGRFLGGAGIVRADPIP